MKHYACVLGYCFRFELGFFHVMKMFFVYVVNLWLASLFKFIKCYVRWLALELYNICTLCMKEFFQRELKVC